MEDMVALIVDDKEENIYFLEVLLKNSGMKTLRAQNGEEALELMESNQVDIIISDILMPVMDGYQFCRHVRANPDNDAIPFVFYTATYTSSQDEKFALKLGADKFLIKPCEPEAFVKVVKESLDEFAGKGNRREPTEQAENNEFLKLYNSRLVSKLEKKTQSLEKQKEERDLIIKKLEKSQASLAEAQRIANIGNWDCHLDTKGLFWSEQIYRILGLDPDATSPSIEMYVQMALPEDREPLQNAFDLSLTKAEPIRMDHGLVRPDGEIRYVHIRGEIPKQNSKDAALIGTIQDITARKNAENELQELHKLQEERIGQIQNLNDYLEAFDYSVSNALRVPIRHMQGFCQLLLEEVHPNFSEKMKKFLTKIITSANEMKQMVDDLMRLSMVGRIDIKREKIDLVVVLRNIVHQLKEEMDIDKVELTINGDIPAYGDMYLMQMALRNLAHNSLKYHEPSRDIQIEFGVEKRDKQQVYYLRDNGIGFDPPRAESIFLPFHDFHRDVSFEGLGLGLATTRKIIERHNGRIWAESQSGQGATFYFTL